MENLDHYDIFVMADEVIPGTYRRYFENFYQPIIGLVATSLYNLLQNMINNPEYEAKITYFDLVSRLGIENEKDFIPAKERLEAVGLLEIYEKDALLIFLLKPPLKPIKFFDNLLLANLLRGQIGNLAFEELQQHYLVKRYDLKKFNRITKSFDEVYDIDYYDFNNEYDKWWSAIEKNYPKLSKSHFDYEVLIALIEPSKLINDKILKSSDFYNFINTVSFQYNLTPEEIAEGIRRSANIEHTFDRDLFLKAIAKIYESKMDGKKIVYKTPIRQEETDEKVALLDNLRFNDLMKTCFNTSLTSSEINMFNTLNIKYGFSNGFINVLILYVCRNQNGNIPTLNYFLKIANNWYRQGIRTTKEALDYIENENRVVKAPKKYQQPKKTLKDPDWLEEHLQETKKKINVEEEPTKSISELEEFFRNRNNKNKN